MLGPFHSHEAEVLPSGSTMSHDPAGERCLVLCTLKDTEGRPIPDVKIDIWETDSSGHYDVQYPDREGPDGRAVMRSDANGRFWFKAIKPVPYPIPHDGPVGRLLKLLHRHPYRPSHMHFMFAKEGFDHLITYGPPGCLLLPQVDENLVVYRALYLRGDPYETSDAVFGVKESLLVDLSPVTDSAMAKEYDVELGTTLLQHDFVLVSDKEADALREKNALEALHKLGLKVKLLDGLPVPDVD